MPSFVAMKGPEARVAKTQAADVRAAMKKRAKLQHGGGSSHRRCARPFIFRFGFAISLIFGLVLGRCELDEPGRSQLVAKLFPQVPVEVFVQSQSVFPPIVAVGIRIMVGPPGIQFTRTEHVSHRKSAQ